jgi:heptosyltransferase-2
MTTALQQHPSSYPIHFLVPAYTGLGNFILMTPMIQELRRKFPDSRIDVLAGNSYGTESVLKGRTDLVNETLILSENASTFEKISFFLKLRGRYDVIFFPFGVILRDIAIGAILAGIPRRIGHAETVSGPYRYFFTDRVAYYMDHHETDTYLDLLGPLLHGSFDRNYEQTVFVADDLVLPAKKELEACLNGQPFLTLQITAATGSFTPKIWPAAHWQDLISCLLNEGCRLVVLGDQRERLYTEQLLSGFGDAVLNLTGKLSIPEAALVISMSKGLICHDSGLMHVANALDVPLLALYGPTDYNRTRPLGKQSHVIRLDLDCMPCLAKKKWTEAEALKKCPHHVACMTKIEPAVVFERAKEIFFCWKGKTALEIHDC